MARLEPHLSSAGKTSMLPPCAGGAASGVDSVNSAAEQRAKLAIGDGELGEVEAALLAQIRE